MSARRRSAAALVVLLAAVGAVTASPTGAAPAPEPQAGAAAVTEDCTCGLSAEDTAFIDLTVARFMAENDLVGVTVSLDLPGVGRFARSYGEADRETGRALGPEDHFRIASVTKTFVANAVLQLVDDGRLGLDDTLGNYVTGVPNGDVISIRQLLGMRAGVFNFVDDPEFLEAYKADPLLPWWSPADVISILQRNQPAYPPGERTVYSDSNYLLLGMVLEQVTGEPAEWWITREVIRPLGLGHTSFPTSPAIPDPYAHGYDATSGTLQDLTWSTPEVPWTAGAMISTVPDLLTYAEQLARGALLSEELQRQRLHFSQMSNPGGPYVGYGLGILKIGDWLGHDGSIFGYSNMVAYLPEQGASMVVMGNTGSTTLVAALPIWFAIAQHLYPDSFPTT